MIQLHLQMLVNWVPASNAGELQVHSSRVSVSLSAAVSSGKQVLESMFQLWCQFKLAYSAGRAGPASKHVQSKQLPWWRRIQVDGSIYEEKRESSACKSEIDFKRWRHMLAHQDGIWHPLEPEHHRVVGPRNLWPPTCVCVAEENGHVQPIPRLVSAVENALIAHGSHLPLAFRSLSGSPQPSWKGSPRMVCCLASTQVRDARGTPMCTNTGQWAIPR